MNRSLNGAGALLALVSLACTRTEPGSGSVLADLEKTIASQQTVNHYLFTSVTPKLRTCWDKVQGEGTVDLALRYRRSEGHWVFERADSIRSTLPPEQAAIALGCMQESAAGSSFDLDEPPGGKDFEQFVLKWTWLVPLPPEGSEVMARRAGGLTPAAGCAKCIANIPARCQWSQSGSEEDCRVDGPNACSTSGTKCLTGIYGRAGDMIVVF
jgi:hypothetical protein